MDAARAAATGSHRPFVGRDDAVAQMSIALENAAAGYGSVLRVCGEAGIGKTRLAEEVRDIAAASGWTTAWASCWDGGAPAFWPWTQVLRSILALPEADELVTAAGLPARDALALVPEARVSLGLQSSPDHSVDASRFRLFDGVLALLRAAASVSRLLVVVEDVHWADPASIRLLHFMAGNLHGVGLVVVATQRDDEQLPAATDEAMADLAAHTAVLALGGLGEADVAALLAMTAGDAPEEDVANAVAARSGGNPLFVRELGRLMATRRASGRTSPTDLSEIPSGVRVVLDRRLARIPQRCHELLTHAAVIGAEFEASLMAEVAESSTGDVLGILDDAVTQKLLRQVADRPECFRFSHDLVREVLVDGIPLPLRSRLHQRVADAIGNRGETAARINEVARHRVEAVTVGGAGRAVEACELAARQAFDMRGYEAAVEWLTKALDLLGPTAETSRDALLLFLGEASSRAGNEPVARRSYLEAAGRARLRGDAVQLSASALGLSAGFGGFEVQIDDREQIAILESALDAFEPDDPKRSWVMARLSVALSLLGEDERRRSLAEGAVDLARRIPGGGPGAPMCRCCNTNAEAGRIALAHALAAHCDTIAGPDHPRDRRSEADEVIQIATATANPCLELLGRRHRIVALLELGDVGPADTEIAAFTRTAGPLRQPTYDWYVPLWKAMRALMDGDLASVPDLIADIDDIGAAAHSTNAVMLARTSELYLELTTRQSGRAVDWHAGAQLEHPVHSPVLSVVLAMVEARLGSTDRARAHLGGVDLAAVPFDAEWLSTMCALTEAVAVLGDAATAQTAYEMLAPYCELFAIDGIGAVNLGSVHQRLGSLSAVCGRPGLSLWHFDEAERRHRRVGAAGLVAETQAARAEALMVMAADSDTIATAVAVASEAFEGLGAPRRAAELRALSVSGEAAISGHPAIAASGEAVLRRSGDLWLARFAGVQVPLRDQKGIRDLAVLLGRPGVEVAAVDLAGVPAEGDAGEVLDVAARTAYRRRLVDLEEEIEDAEAFGDTARAEKARTTRDLILAELAAAVGLGGRARRSGSASERARSAVTQRIRASIGRIEQVHPALGRHLRSSIRTGTFCSYEPSPQVKWEITP